MLLFTVNTDCKTDGTTNEVESAETEIRAMNIPTFINNLGDFDKLSHDATKVLQNVRDNVVKQVRVYILVCFGLFVALWRSMTR